MSREAIALRVGSECACSPVKFVQPILGTYPHRAHAINVHRVHAVVAQSAGTIYVVLIDSELSRHWIELLQASRVGTKPQNSFTVFDHFQIRQSSVRSQLIRGEAFSRRVEAVQPILRGGPEYPVVVDEQARYKIVAQTVGICWVVPVRLEMSCPPVESEEPVAIRANPQKT